MNIPHVHLALNHIPVIGIIFVGILLAVSMVLKNTQFQRVALVFLFFVALSAIPVFLTGEGAEEIVEDIPEVSEEYIEEHEEAALISLIFMEILGGLSLLSILLFRKLPGYQRFMTSGMLILTLIVMALFIWTAYLGGHIRHSEIRPDFQMPSPADSGEGGLQGEIRISRCYIALQ